MWEKDSENWGKMLSKTLKNNALNFATGLILLLVDLKVWKPHELLYSVEEYPSLFDNFYQIMFCAIVHDTINFWAHKFLHIPIIYPYLHKIHH